MRLSLPFAALLLTFNQNLAPGLALAGWELVLGDSTVQSPPVSSSGDKLEAANPSPDRVQPDCQHMVRPGETLSGIAKSRLGDATAWRQLAQANNLPSDGRVTHGTLLNLPCHGDWTTSQYREIDSPVETRDLATAIRESKGSVAEDGSDSPDPSKQAIQLSRTSDASLSEVQDLHQELAGTLLPSGPGTLETGPDNNQESVASPAIDLSGKENQDTQTKPGNVSMNPGGESEPVWRARGGSLLDDVIAEWTLKSGYRLIIKDRWSWKLDYDYHYNGDLKGAITDLMTGYSHTLPAPVVTFYSNDVVVLSVN